MDNVVSKRPTNHRARAQARTGRGEGCFYVERVFRTRGQGLPLDAEGGAADEEGSFASARPTRFAEYPDYGRPYLEGTETAPLGDEEE